MSKPLYSRDLLARTAAASSSLVDLMRRLGTPLGSRPRHYLKRRLAHYDINTSHFREEDLPEREPRSYPEDLLTEAAARSHSIREVIEYMGFSPLDCPYGHIRKRLDHFGIDTSHFTTARGATFGFSQDELTRAVAESRGLAGVMRALGLPPFNGAGRAEVARSIDAYGLSTEHFVGQGHRLDIPSPSRKSADEVLRRLNDNASRTKTSMLRRALDEVGVPHRCVACGLGDVWQGKRLVLEIDHINGDRLDNRRQNLRYLCPSCHSQTRTFANPTRSGNPRLDTPMGTVK